MNYYIIKTNANYADEFDIEGFTLKQSELDLKDFKNEYYKNIEEGYGKYPIESYFGSNESIEINNRKELEKIVQVKKITEEEYKIINKVLGSYFGMNLF